jgi:hypothetical protein
MYPQAERARLSMELAQKGGLDRVQCSNVHNVIQYTIVVSLRTCSWY